MKSYDCRFSVILLASLVGCDVVELLSSVWVPGDVRIRNLTRVVYHGFDGLDDAIDHSFDTADDQRAIQVKRNFIDLQPAFMRQPHSALNSSVLANMQNETAWAFMSVIIIPPISCESMMKVAYLFDTGLRHANPDARQVESTARRIGSDACGENGVCPCIDERIGTARYTTRVLELETLCEVRRLALPVEDEFPFVYDSRTAMPYPGRKKRGRILDEGEGVGHFMVLAESIFRRFVEADSSNSSTLISSSAMRLSNSTSVDLHV